MQSTAERRVAILEFLCLRRTSSLLELASEFYVTKRTIKNDLQVLMCSYPIYTTQGKGGGVHIMNGYKLGMKYLTDNQIEVLQKISKNLKGAELKEVQAVISTFSLPRK